MLVQSTKAFGVDRLKFLVFGAPGVGKTSLAGTTGEPTIVISAEAGLLVLKDKDLDVLDITTDDQGKLLPKEARFARLKEAFAFLTTDAARTKYKWVVIDSLTEIGQNLVEHLQQKYPNAKDALVMWGEYSKDIRSLIKAFRDLPYYHVVFTALSDKEKDENGQFFTGIALNGKISQALPGFFDEVFYLQVLKDHEGKTSRRLLTQATDTIVAKDRSGALNPYEEPNLKTITNKITGRKN